jgi:hypothetical protein
VTTVVISGLVEKGGPRYARLRHQTGFEEHWGSARATLLTDEGWHRSGGGAHGGDSVPLGMSHRRIARSMDLTASPDASGWPGAGRLAVTTGGTLRHAPVASPRTGDVENTRGHAPLRR